MSDPIAAILATHPELRPLVELQQKGWRLTPVVGDDRTVTRIDGMRTLPDPFNPEVDWVEVVMVLSETDAKGLRQDPDGDIVWCHDGTLADVVNDLLELPKPGEPGAPRLVISRGQQLWTP